MSARDRLTHFAAASLAASLCLITACAAGPVDQNGDGILRPAVIGDSNSTTGWVAMAAEILPRTTVDGRMMLVDWLNAASPGQSACGGFNALDEGGKTQVAKLLPKADLFIVALGTNDELRPRRTPKEIVDCLTALRDQAAPRRVFVALIPPTISPAKDINPAIDATNSLIRNAFGRDVLDFHELRPEDFLGCLTSPCVAGRDGFHIGPTGQRAWAERAVEAVRGG